MTVKVSNDHSGRKGHNEQWLNGSIDGGKDIRNKENEGEWERKRGGSSEDGESKEDELARINSSALALSAPKGAVFGRTWPSDFSNTRQFI